MPPLTNLVLALSACLINDPATCKDTTIPLKAEVGVVGCMMASQIEAAKWLEGLPGYQITKSRCINPSRVAAAT
jgi:hypothetical protein